ncbi:unnamed protein product, partial [marine sediment metagenome]
PQKEIKKIYRFLDSDELDLEKMIASVDQNLYRKRRR